jgi:hypothetical protein
MLDTFISIKLVTINPEFNFYLSVLKTMDEVTVKKVYPRKQINCSQCTHVDVGGNIKRHKRTTCRGAVKPKKIDDNAFLCDLCSSH